MYGGCLLCPLYPLLLKNNNWFTDKHELLMDIARTAWFFLILKLVRNLIDSLVRNFKNCKIVLSESPNLAMTLVPDFFLARLVGTIYRLEGLNKTLIECTSALISVICLPQEHRITIFATRRKKLMLPKPWTDWRSSREQSSWGNMYIKYVHQIHSKSSSFSASAKIAWGGGGGGTPL